MTLPRLSAQDRTISLFSGVSQEETDKFLMEQASIDAPDHTKQPENIEVAAERWRANAFFTQEHLSKHFNDGEPGKAIFRLTEKDGWQFLEQFRLGKDGKAYGWTGLMFKDTDLNEITGVFVKAARAKQGSQ